MSLRIIGVRALAFLPPFLLMSVLAVPAQEKPAAEAESSQLEITWNAVDGDGNPVKNIAPGTNCTLHVTLHVRARKVRISEASASRSIVVRTRGIRGRIASHDWETGTATVNLRAKGTLQKPVDTVTVTASLILGEENGLWYRAVVEKAQLTLPSGRSRMKTAHLLYHGDTGPRSVLRVGDVAPDFTAINKDGKAVGLSGFRKKQAVVLVFGRAHW